MASSTLSALWALSVSQKPSSKINGNRSHSRVSSKVSSDLQVKQRRSAGYHPTIWETDHIQSFVTPYSYKSHEVRLGGLKQRALLSLKTTNDPRALLSLVDSMQRLGIAYHFEDEIRDVVSLVSRDKAIDDDDDDLYMTALKFRILREHRLEANSGVFNRFRGGEGRFLSSLSKDVEALLSLYEASHFGVLDEDVLEEANNFASTQLKCCSGSILLDNYLAKQVHQSLEVPLYWRMPRIEARNFIDLYQFNDEMYPNLLEFAKLDYNLVQSVYQDELKELAWWWRNLGFKENLEFARDRLMENYLWAMGIVFEPRLSKCRVGLTKFVCILTVIDDIYDVYGSPDELESFTNAVERWDVEAMTDLPHYMKVCYLGMLNFGNEIIYDVLKIHGLDVCSYIKKEWLNLCKSYLVEARWFNSGHKPSLEEYLGNACTSVGGHAGIVHAYILSLLHQDDEVAPPTTSHLDLCFDNASELIHWSSLVTRLSDDLGTSADESKRGDVPKSVECYMFERGATEEEAQNDIKELIKESWKMINKEVNSDVLPNSMVRMCLNMARTAQCIFQHGDGIGTSTGVTKERLLSLIVKPIPF